MYPFGGDFQGGAKVFTTSSNHAHTAARVRGLRLCPFFVAEQRKDERKSAKGLRPLETAPLPLCKESLGEKHGNFKCISRRVDTTSGRRKKQNILLKWGADNKSKFFYRRALRATQVSAAFFKPCSQKLKMLAFVKR